MLACRNDLISCSLVWCCRAVRPGGLGRSDISTPGWHHSYNHPLVIVYVRGVAYAPDVVVDVVMFLLRC